jgi:hypothetical protein
MHMEDDIESRTLAYINASTRPGVDHKKLDAEYPDVVARLRGEPEPSAPKPKSRGLVEKIADAVKPPLKLEKGLPEGWRGLDWKKRVKLANELGGDVSTAEDADAFLQLYEEGGDIT